MHRVVIGLVMLGKVMHLGVAVMAGGDAIIGAGFQNLIQFQPAVFMTCLGVTGLQVPAAAAAAIIVGPVGIHINEIFFSDNTFHDKPEIFGHGITKALSYQLAGVLNGKFYLEILIPIGIYFQLSFPDPLGVKLNNALDFKFVLDVEFFQSGPDCK
jgi:hypothetical protein